PGLPLQIFRLDRLAEPDIGFGDEDVHGLQLRDRYCGGGFIAFRAARQICGNAAGAERDDQDDNTRSIHTLHYSYAGDAGDCTGVTASPLSITRQQRCKRPCGIRSLRYPEPGFALMVNERLSAVGRLWPDGDRVALVSSVGSIQSGLGLAGKS